MGCDIHVYVEYKRKDQADWRDFGGRINPGRNYLLFGMMSHGVRTEPDFSFRPKGLPENTAHASRSDSRIYICETGEDNVTAAKAKRWVASGDSVYINDSFVTNPDWHSHSWLTTGEYKSIMEKYAADNPTYNEPEYHAILACMEKFESMGYDSRIVFWFDN